MADCRPAEPVNLAEPFDPVNAPTPHDDPRHPCRGCGGAGRRVTRKTVLLMLKPEHLDRAVESEYRFCPAHDCRVVYCGETLDSTFTTGELRVRVGLKERGDPVPLCYCFGFDEGGARAEISQTGTSTIPQRIVALIKQGMCACTTRNPSGACCLGDVYAAVKRLTSETAGATGLNAINA